MKNRNILMIAVAAGVGYWAYKKYLAPLPAPQSIVTGDTQSISSLPTSGPGQYAMAGIKRGSMN